MFLVSWGVVYIVTWVALELWSSYCTYCQTASKGESSAPNTGKIPSIENRRTE